jgi:hypothetical protein
MLSLEMSGYNYSKKRCSDVVNWFMEKHLPRHKIDLVVHHRGLLREGVYGWICVTDCDWRPRAFEIEMHNQMDPDHYVRTLLHELWHLYQHVKGSLRDKRGKRYWRGIDHTETDYSDQPWEQQAFQMEDVLYDEYMNVPRYFPNRLTSN